LADEELDDLMFAETDFAQALGDGGRGGKGLDADQSAGADAAEGAGEGIGTREIARRSRAILR
jgi:hypothetical protein